MANEVLLGAARHTKILHRDPGSSLAGAGSVTSMVRAVGHQRVVGQFSSDVAPANGYPRIRQSNDGSTWSRTTVISRDLSQANFVYPFDITIKYPYVSVEFTNGSSAATAFEAAAYLVPVFGSGVDVVPGEDFTQLIRSDKDSHFTTSLTVNNHETENLTGLSSNVGRIVSLTILSVQNLDWEVVFWKTDGFDDSDLDSDSSLDSVFVSALDAFNISNATPTTYRYHVTGLNIPYVDEDGTNELHVSLIPRNGTKNAGAAGEVVVEVGFDPGAV